MLKILLVLFALFVLLWLVRGATSRRKPPSSAAPAGAAPQEMLACSQCGVHLPRDEVLPGRGGVFCGEPHRAAFEREHSQG